MNTENSDASVAPLGRHPELPEEHEVEPAENNAGKKRLADPGITTPGDTPRSETQPPIREDGVFDPPPRRGSLVKAPAEQASEKQAPPPVERGPASNSGLAAAPATATRFETAKPAVSALGRESGSPPAAMENVAVPAEPVPAVRPKPEWKVLEPEGSTDAVEHEVWELRRRSDRWDMVAASVRGKLHAHKAMWREDAYGIGWTDDWTIIAVSDGAGSAELSRIGARVACEVSVASLQRLLAGWHPKASECGPPPESDLVRLRAFLVEAARKAQEGILRAAQGRKCLPRKMHATLLLLVHVPLGQDELVGAIQIGDGAVGIYVEDGTCTLLGVPDHGEYSSETRFLTTPNIEREFERRVLFSIKRGIRCLGVMCDGVADDFFPEEKRLVDLFVGDPIEGMRTKDDEPVRGVMHEVLQNPRGGESLRDWLRYEKKASSDDRTLVLMYRREDA